MLGTQRAKGAGLVTHDLSQVAAHLPSVPNWGSWDAD